MAPNILPSHEIEALLDSLELPTAGARRAAGVYLLKEMRKLTQRRPPPAPDLPANVLHLVPRTPPKPTVDADTVQILETLLAEAKAGRCTGLAYVAAMGRRGYVADTHGDARRSPTWTRGALRGLDDKLAERCIRDGRR